MPAEGAPSSTSPGALSTRAFSLAAASLVALYLLAAWLQHSPALFGAFHDDTLYFSTARAIAEGQGAVLPHLPGSPPQTKYPPLYPLVLSLAWSVQPEFPASLTWAWALNLLFGCWMVLAAVAVLRRLGCTRVEALGLGALFALNPYTILWTNLLLSDVLFAALTLSAVAAGEYALRAGKETLWVWWGVAVSAGILALLTRTLGVAVLGGLALFALSRRRYLAAGLAAAGASPVLASLIGRVGGPGPSPTAGRLSGFDQNWLYYTNYIDFWRLSVPDWDVLWAQVQFTGLELLKYPAVATFFFDAEGMANMYMQAAAVAISVAVVHGVVLRVKSYGISVLHWSAMLYAIPILLWNYTLMSRFWLAFLPLLLLGAYTETRRLAASVAETFRPGVKADQKVAAGLMGLALAALVLSGAWSFAVEVPANVRALAAGRQKTLAAKQEAYGWLRERNDKFPVISYEDGLLYLHVGAAGMRPFSLSTEAFFRQDEAIMKRDIARLSDTAVELNARYWLTSADDFELDYAQPQLAAAARETLESAPVVFQSEDGSVRVHELEGALSRSAK